MIKGMLYSYFLKAIMVALLGLILYGVFPGRGLVAILMLFVGLRGISLATEALRNPVPDESREATLNQLKRSREKLIPKESAIKAASHKMQSMAPRPKRELVAEGLGVLAFALLLPLNIAIIAPLECQVDHFSPPNRFQSPGVLGFRMSEPVYPVRYRLRSW